MSLHLGPHSLSKRNHDVIMETVNRFEFHNIYVRNTFDRGNSLSCTAEILQKHQIFGQFLSKLYVGPRLPALRHKK